MKAIKLDLSRYETTQRDEKGDVAMYDCRTSLVTLLFHPALELNASQVLDASDLARKVRDAGDTLLVTPEEYDRVTASVNAAVGYGEHDVEFVRRMMNVEDVEVEEKEIKA